MRDRHAGGALSTTGAGTSKPAPRIGALLLAAGASSRLGAPKQLLQDGDGRPLVASVVRDLQRSGCDPVVVVVGAHAEEVVHALITNVEGVILVPHRGWDEGMGSSIRAGIAAMSVHPAMHDVTGAIIAACDMPAVDAAHFAALIDAWSRTRASAGARIASEYHTTARDGSDAIVTLGIPALFPREDWLALVGLSGDRGAKSLLERSDTIPVRLMDGTFDLDTPADVAAWRASTRS